MMILLHHIRVNEIDDSGKNCSEKHRKSPDGFWSDCTLYYIQIKDQNFKSYYNILYKLYNIGFKVLILNLNFFNESFRRFTDTQQISYFVSFL